MSETAHIPQLRFPDFSDDWEASKLGDVTSKIGSGSTPRGGEKVYTSDGILFIRSQNVKRNILDLTDSTFIPEEVHFQMSGSEVKSNDVLLNITGASIGRSCVVPSSVITGNVNQHVCIVRTGRHLESNFLQPFLASHRGQKLIYQGQTGSGREGLNFQSIRSFKLNLPAKLEQQKIATFLTAVDTKIEQLSKKQELLGEYKKGLMQQIFSQAIRFKADDGSEFPDWEEKRLEDVAEIVGGGTPPTAVEKYWGGDIQWFTPTEIKSKYIVNSKRTITQVGLDTSSARLLPKGTLLFSSRATVGEIGIAVQECTTNQGFQSFIVNKNNEPEFLYNWIIKNKKEFIRRASGSTFLEIGKSEIKKIKLNIPLLSEQTKIASFLSSIDTKIEQVSKQLDESKQFKKALLQQMFV